jgi:Mn2+/Fe2+ NRAMP family transporter
MTTQSSDDNQHLVISYLTLRKAVGILGMVLPFLLIFGYLLFDKKCTFPPSISHFYYTAMGDWFVGTLSGVALFLFCYNGHDEGDKVAAKIAATFALLVALFPTDFGSYADMECSRITDGEDKFSNIVHYVSACILFATFAFFSLIQFTKSKKPGPMGQPKKNRNKVYRVCGWVIVVCIVAISLVSFIDPLYEMLKPYKPTFVLETVALLAFGFSWLVKGETFFKDKKKA